AGKIGAKIRAHHALAERRAKQDGQALGDVVHPGDRGDIGATGTEFRRERPAAPEIGGISGHAWPPCNRKRPIVSFLPSRGQFRSMVLPDILTAPLALSVRSFPDSMVIPLASSVILFALLSLSVTVCASSSSTTVRPAGVLMVIDGLSASENTTRTLRLVTI